MAETTDKSTKGLKIGFDCEMSTENQCAFILSLFVISKSTLGGKADLDEGF